mmetsp:Transcript_14440/g.43367  ORF Transcript_14440/g.43367 Transcript_14440/m.43367 type:complete len:213 (+) Transcript_14440:132-770(+)
MISYGYSAKTHDSARLSFLAQKNCVALVDATKNDTPIGHLKRMMMHSLRAPCTSLAARDHLPATRGAALAGSSPLSSSASWSYWSAPAPPPAAGRVRLLRRAVALARQATSSRRPFTPPSEGTPGRSSSTPTKCTVLPAAASAAILALFSCACACASASLLPSSGTLRGKRRTKVRCKLFPSSVGRFTTVLLTLSAHTSSSSCRRRSISEEW